MKRKFTRSFTLIFYHLSFMIVLDNYKSMYCDYERESMFITLHIEYKRYECVYAFEIHFYQVDANIASI